MAFKTGTAGALWACCWASLVAALAGCSDLGFGRPKLDPNAYPANYKIDLLAYVRIHPVDMLDAREAYVSTPALKQFGADSRYFVCLRADGQDWRKEKFVTFFAGQINQFVDATSEQCAAAAYQSFPELLPELGKPREKK
jgi:hypothetical protein